MSALFHGIKIVVPRRYRNVLCARRYSYVLCAENNIV